MSSIAHRELETASRHHLIACHECDLLHRLHPLAYGERAKCSRCGALLYAKKRDSFEHTIVFAVTSLLLFILANVFPFMTFELHGRVQTSHLSTGVWEFFERGMWELGLLVLAASILFPGLKILGMLYVLVPLEMNRRPWKAPQVFRVVAQCQTWAMMDVYLLGVIVAVIKLADLATLVPGVAIYAFGALILTLAAADSALDPHAVWEKMEDLR
jgi:paraquat-inducible protein A